MTRRGCCWWTGAAADTAFSCPVTAMCVLSSIEASDRGTTANGQGEVAACMLHKAPHFNSHDRLSDPFGFKCPHICTWHTVLLFMPEKHVSLALPSLGAAFLWESHTSTHYTASQLVALRYDLRSSSRQPSPYYKPTTRPGKATHTQHSAHAHTDTTFICIDSSPWGP